MKAIMITIATVLLLGSVSLHAAPCAGFVDVEDTSPFCPNVAWMKQNGITLGCSATRYCPNDFVTRLQMAGFMGRFGNLVSEIAELRREMEALRAEVRRIAPRAAERR
jgi:hypothetical protein